MFAASFTIATLIPSFALSSIPTVGLSTFCFALLAIIVPLIRHKLLYNAYWAAFILFDFCVPSVNAAAHLFAYTAGLLIAAINTPLTWHPK